MMYVFWLVAVWKFVCLHRSCPHYTAIWVLSLTLSHEAIRHLFTLYSAQDKTSTPHLVEQIIALTFSQPRAASIIKSFPGDTKEKSCSLMWICILLSKTSWTACSEEWDPQDSDVRLSSWALPPLSHLLHFDLSNGNDMLSFPCIETLHVTEEHGCLWCQGTGVHSHCEPFIQPRTYKLCINSIGAFAAYFGINERQAPQNIPFNVWYQYNFMLCHTMKDEWRG